MSLFLNPKTFLNKTSLTGKYKDYFVSVHNYMNMHCLDTLSTRILLLITMGLHFTLYLLFFF
uniref:Uncharacterized protein n=1 Tax=Dromaius novaehollandiae TaxID=8790 RepID=A0A8C4KJH5_DRONO